MSWSRFERSYLANLAACAPDTPLEQRQALARFSVDKIRAVIEAGVRASPYVLFVGAAGNFGVAIDSANSGTRFNAPIFLMVGAVDSTGTLTDLSNHGPEVTLYANGVRVPARLPGGARTYPTGTSMAAPVVTNAAVRVLAANPRLIGAEVRAILEETADPNSTGQPVLNAARAIERAAAYP